MEDARFEELLSLYADGRATPEELGELEALLRESGPRRRSFVGRMRLEADLNELLTGVETAAGGSPPPRGVRRAGLRRLGRSRPAAWGPAFFAAAALLGVALLIFAVGPSDEEPVSPPPATAREDGPPAPAPEIPAPTPPPAPRPVRTEGPRPAPPPIEKKPGPPSEDLKRKAEEAFRKARAEAARRGTDRPKPVEPRPESTRPAIAALQEVEGEVLKITPQGSRPALAGQPILDGEGLIVSGRALVRYPDATVLHLASGARVERLSLTDRGKRVELVKGLLTADVKKQPAGEVMILSSPHAEVRVLGTELQLEVGEDSTRLEVSEGRVRLRRHSDGKSVLVSAGHFVVAGAQGPLKAEKLPAFVLRISFGPPGAPVPAGYQADEGAVFDAKRGWGWNRDKSRSARHRASEPDPLLARHIGAGGAAASDRWEVVVPNGRYRVSVGCGDPQTAQGPHRVVVEGVVAVKDHLTAAGEYVRAENVVVRVRDGRLTLDAGAVGTRLTDPGGDTDTSLKYIVITRIR